MYCLTDSIIINLSSECTATTYRSFFFVRKSPNIYDNAESVIGGYLLDRDTVRRADTKQSTVDNRYICVKGLDHSPKEWRRNNGAKARTFTYYFA